MSLQRNALLSPIGLLAPNQTVSEYWGKKILIGLFLKLGDGEFEAELKFDKITAFGKGRRKQDVSSL